MRKKLEAIMLVVAVAVAMGSYSLGHSATREAEAATDMLRPVKCSPTVERGQFLFMRKGIAEGADSWNIRAFGVAMTDAGNPKQGMCYYQKFPQIPPLASGATSPSPTAPKILSQNADGSIVYIWIPSNALRDWDVIRLDATTGHGQRITLDVR